MTAPSPYSIDTGGVGPSKAVPDALLDRLTHHVHPGEEREKLPAQSRTPHPKARTHPTTLNHTYFGPDEKRSGSELVEQHFTRLLEDVVLHHWSDEVITELEDGLRRARFEPRGKPLADITWAIRGQQPEKAARISCILLDEHERHTTAALEDDLKLPYLPVRWSHHH